jgi:capsular polysaccharide transport system permease protein
MIDRIKQSRFGQAAARLAVWNEGWRVPALLQRRSYASVFAASLLAILYWGVIASDRYVSEAHVVIHGADLASAKDVGGAGSLVAQMLLRDYLLSVDMLKRLEDKLKLREHYSDRRRDPLSRMWFRTAPLEWFHSHYLSRISVELDPGAFVLVIRAQAYDPATAHAIAVMLVEEGERYMNSLGQRMAGEQVAFLEKQVAQLNERVVGVRRDILGYQNRKGLVSPQGTAENLAGIVSRLEAQLADLQTRLSVMQAYLMPDSSSIIDLNLQIAAVEKQIAREKKRLAAPGDQALNKMVEEYQRLQMNAEMSLAVYQTALTALEKGRIDAMRKLMAVSVLQSPSEPQYPLEPRRIYNIVVFILVILLIAGIAHLLAAIVRDHTD